MGRGVTARALLALLVLAPAAALWPRPASAHGGKLAIRTTSGPYHIESVVSRVGGRLDETVSVTSAQNGKPVTGVVVVISLQGSDGQRLGPFVAQPLGGLYEVRYPTQEGQGWNVLISVQGPPGDVEVQHAYTTPGSITTGFLLTALGALALIVLPILAYRFWFRSPPQPAPAGESLKES